MSVQAMTWAMDFSSHKGADLLVLIIIGNYANEQGYDAWPSIDKLALKARMNRRSIFRILERLEASGELIIDRGAGPKGCHKFTFTWKTGGVTKRHGANMSPVTLTTAGGDSHDLQGVTPVSPEPSVEPSENPSSTGAAGSPAGSLLGGDLLEGFGWLHLTKAERLQVDVRFLEDLEFMGEWEKFRKHRAGKRKALTVPQAEKLFADFGDHDIRDITAAVALTIRKGWNDVYVERIEQARAAREALERSPAENLDDFLGLGRDGEEGTA